ncbi:AMP-binding protein [Nocardia sp. NPDC051756]|uniref:AMP-binding protein n=1 Tax=Nocardia sp. NPDC051756 TaxID=3154751 RepID=UPI00341F7F80
MRYRLRESVTRPTPEQLRLCIAQNIDPRSTAFNYALLLRLAPSIDTNRFRDAVAAIIASHDALRGRFERGGPDGWIVRECLPAQHESNVVTLNTIDLADRAQAEVERPFDLSQDPPVRVHWWHLGNELLCQLTFHHIAIDASTIELLLEGIRAEYNEPLRPRIAPPSYYAHAAKRWHAHETPIYRKRLDEYVRKFDGSTIEPLLPSTVNRHTTTAQLVWQVADETDGAAAEHAYAAKCTRFAVWLNAWTRALSLAFDREEIPVVVPMSSRRSPAEMATVGFFINSVVVPGRQNRREKFGPACRRVADELLDALDRRDLPLHELVHELSMPKRGADNPLVGVSAQMLRAQRRFLHLADGTVAITCIDSLTPRYPLSLEIRIGAGASEVCLRADRTLVEPGRLQALRHLMEDDLLSRAFTASRDLAPPTIPQPLSTEAISAPILRWARHRPHDIAVRWDNGSWTWTHLVNATDEMITQLRTRGVARGTTVTIELGRGPHYVAALLAVFRLGAIAVLTRSGWSEPERRKLSGTTGACARIAGPRRVLSGVDETDTTAGESSHPIPSGTAYITFTSGSTGPPKALPAPISGVLDYLESVVTTTAIGPEDRCLQVAGAGFDALIRDTLVPLRSGATLVILPEPLRLSGRGIAETIEQEQITAILALIPPQLRLLLDHLHAPAPHVLCVAGEPLFRADCRRLHQIDCHSRLFNLYGPTETTMTSTCLEVEDRIQILDRLPVGHPSTAAGVHILSRDGAELPEGCKGEIVISGSGVTPGYLGNHTAAAGFAVRMLAGQPRWSYATGDSGYWLNDGFGLRVTGRLDANHKVLGERVDLAAVESALVGHPAVVDAVATIEPHGHFSIVSAQVVLRDPTISTEALRQFLKGKISPAATPHRIATVEHISRLANGKTDRRLPHTSVGSEAAKPGRLGQSWPRVRRVVDEILTSRVTDPQANLFALGADSVAVIEILERLDILDAAPQAFDDPRMTTLVDLVEQPDRQPHTKAPRPDNPGLLIPIGEPTHDPENPTVICFPPAGGDLVSFAPLAQAMEGRADIIVARRPQPHDRTGSVASWVDAHVMECARYAVRRGGTVVVCGYSVGFLLACLTADALRNRAGVRAIIGINPSIPVNHRKYAGRSVTTAAVLGTTAADSVTRLHADLDILSVTSRMDACLPELLLLQTLRDKLRWDNAVDLGIRKFTTVHTEPIEGKHTLSNSDMYAAAMLAAEWITGLEDGGRDS